MRRSITTNVFCFALLFHVCSKAAEFERLLQTKTVAGSNLSDTSKVVICLDLAAGIYGVELDVVRHNLS